VIAIQEIRSVDIAPWTQLMTELNAGLQLKYASFVGERLGRTSSKEQYAFIYNTKVQFEKSYQYVDLLDKFERPPTGIMISHEGLRFSLLNIHTKPDDAVSEVDALVDAYDAMATSLSVQDAIVLGDYNAACSYVKASDWANIRMRTENRFTWWIPDDADTTVNPNLCAYDRLVSVGYAVTNMIITGSSTPFFFDREYGLTLAFALTVSDHYPVELQFHAATLAPAPPPPVSSGSHVGVVAGVIVSIVLLLTAFVVVWLYTQSSSSASSSRTTTPTSPLTSSLPLSSSSFSRATAYAPLVDDTPSQA